MVPATPQHGRKALLFFLFLGVCLWGCATPYRRLKGGTGFSETPVGSDSFQVSFQGNGQTKPEQASDFALLRAAQITIEHGFTCFAVLDITNTSSARPYMVRQQFYSDYPPNMGLPPPSAGGYGAYRFGYKVEYDRPAIYYRPGQRLLIQCFKTKPQKPFTYDAAVLERAIRQKYGLE